MQGLVWKENDQGQLAPFFADQEVVWAPQPGSQEAYLECPIFEVLYEGTRGPGKTDALLMDFASEVGRGWKHEWRGIIFRTEHTQLGDIVAKSKKWFPRIFSGCTYNEARSTWLWASGEQLMFRHAKRPADYWKYHGHGYPFIGWEELCTWPNDVLYRALMSCCRSTGRPGMPRKYRANANPHGVGHNWVKARFKLPVIRGRMHGPVIREQHRTMVGGTWVTEVMERVAIHGDLSENLVLLHSDPGYAAKLSEAATSPAQLKAWLEGDWNIIAGGMFDDLWDSAVHIVPNIPFRQIPRGWRMNRSYDHGQSKPFSVGWWAESNGEPIEVEGRLIGEIPGDLIRVAEWYGCGKQPNQGLNMATADIADGIKDREEDWGVKGRVRSGPADVGAKDPNDPGISVLSDFRKFGVQWDQVVKGQGSRVEGWNQVRKRLKDAVPDERGFRERPGLFACQRCEHFARLLPVLPRGEKNPDDADSEAEDHLADDVRYRVCEERRQARSEEW